MVLFMSDQHILYTVLKTFEDLKTGWETLSRQHRNISTAFGMQNLCEHEKEQTLISLTVWWILSGPVRPLPRALSPEEAVIRLPVSPQVYLERPRSVRPPEHSLTFLAIL